MTNHISDWTGAYVLDAVEPDERALIERHLQACASCRAEVDELRAVAARLGAAAEEDPPEGLRARVLDAVASVDQEGAGARPPIAGSRWRALAVVAALVALAVIGALRSRRPPHR